MDKTGMRSASLVSVSQDLLSAGVVIYTGGHDVANSALLTFPASAHAQLDTWSSDRLLSVLRHYVQWMGRTQHVHTMSYLADLQMTSKTAITVIVEAVEKLELHARGTVNTLYFLKPRVKSRSRLLKKLLGLKPSKKHPKIPLFKVILMKTYQDVFSHIDLCHLTSDFGGTLTYDNKAWMQFYQTVTPCIREAEGVLRRVPELRDRVELLHEYETGEHSAAAIHSLLAELTDKYHLIISEAHFQESLDHCKQTLLVLDSTEASERWLSRVHQELVRRAADCVRQLYQDLDASRWQLEDVWKEIEENVMGHLQIQRHRERAVEIERKIRNYYEPLMQEHPCVGNTLSQAELYRTHFTTTLYEPAKELLSQATEILEHVHRLTEHTQPPCDVTDIIDRLTVALQPFTQRLQSLQDVYVAVHVFHLLFQKAMSWYKKVLKFLPDSLQERVTESARTGTKLLPMPVEWQQTVQSFLVKHPAPREQHIARLDTDIPPQVEKRLRLQARSLALRLRLLHRLLFSRRLPVKLLSAIFRWRADVCNTNAGSTSPTKERPTGKSVGVRDDDAVSKNPAPPTVPLKPVRMQNLLRTVSYSSSDTGDMEVSNMSLVSSSGIKLHDSPSEADGPVSGKPLPETSKDAVQNYGKPPKIDIRIISPNGNTNQGSDVEDDLNSIAHGEEEHHAQGTETDKELTGSERFIRLTFSPTDIPSLYGRAFEYDDNLESEDFSVRFSESHAGSESGIEVAEADDPWDNVIKKIKAVSNSNLPSEVKIQCMSHLLSRSPLAEAQLGHRHGNSGLQYDAGRRTKQHHDDPHHSEDGRRRSVGYSTIFSNFQEELRPRYNKLPSVDSEGQRLREDRFGSGGAGTLHDRRLFSQFHEKPAHTVARLRRCLAKSLWDLNAVDHHRSTNNENLQGAGGWASTTNLNAPPKPARQFHLNTHGANSAVDQTRAEYSTSLMHRSTDNGLDTAHYENSWSGDPHGAVRRSYEDGLESVYLPGRAKQAQNKITAWRSYEDGLDSVNSGPRQADGPSQREVGRSSENGLDFVVPQPRPRYVQSKNADQRNPYRWRQNIIGEYAPSSAKTHHPSRDFIAPSFLRPYNSMTTINFAGWDDETLTFPGHQNMDGNVKVGMAAMSVSDSDSTSYGGSHSDKGGPTFDRLSDDLEQEYLSQDEVESSLKRSQIILMEAEEKLKKRAQRTFSTANDTRVVSRTNPQDDHLTEEKHLTASPTESQFITTKNTDKRRNTDGQYEPVEVRVDEIPDDPWDQQDFDSESPELYSVTSSGLVAGDCEWDADVSNMSDVHPEVRVHE